MSLSPVASLRFNKPHATTALENECSSSNFRKLFGVRRSHLCKRC
jgi:hypothetical protein